MSYVAGSLAAGYLSARTAASRPFAWALSIGGLFTLFNVSNLVFIPHPTWLAVATTICFLPSAYAGARMAQRG